MAGIPLFDHDKCNLCGKCGNICPKDYIKITDNSINMLVSECMLCSHCYSVCPAGAISFKSEDLIPISFESFSYSEKMFSPSAQSPGETVNFMRSRRSVRKYEPRSVDNTVLRDLLQFSVTAPSGSNCQMTEFHVINGQDRVWSLAMDIKDFFLRMNRLSSNFFIRNLYGITRGRPLKKYHERFRQTIDKAIQESEKGRDLLFHGAPCAVIFHSALDGSTPSEDAVLCSYNFALLAHSMGLGTCYIGYAVEAINRTPAIKRKLGIPDTNRIYAVLTIGYPSKKFIRQALRKPFSAGGISR